LPLERQQIRNVAAGTTADPQRCRWNDSRSATLPLERQQIRIDVVGSDTRSSCMSPTLGTVVLRTARRAGHRIRPAIPAVDDL